MASIPGTSDPKPTRRFATRSKKNEKADQVMKFFSESSKYTLGDFLAYILEPEAELSDSAKRSVTSWLQGQTRIGTRPAEIVEAIYRRKDGHERDAKQQLLRPSFADLTPPKHTPGFINSNPTDVSLLPDLPGKSLLAHQTNSRMGLEELMVRGTLCLVEREAQLLAEKDIGLMRSAEITWDDIDGLSRATQEPAIRRQAPIIWNILSTIMLSRTLKSSTAREGTIQGSHSATKARDTVPAIIIVIYMLVSFRNPLVNYIQAVIAIFMFACNSHKVLYQLTNRLGLSIAHSTMHGHLRRLGLSASAELQMLGRQAYESIRNPEQKPQQYFGLVLDNVNSFLLARRQSVANKNQMKNGTAATAIVLEDVVPGAFNPRPYWERVRSRARQGLNVKQLIDDIDPGHLKLVGTGMIMRILLAYVPTLANRFRSKLEEKFRSEDGYAKHRLRLRKSITVPMATSAIDESTADGIVKILHDLVSTQMEMDPSWFNDLLVMVNGDQLTIDRLRKAIRYRATEESVYDSRAWALPTLQIWHLKLAYLRSILKIHWFPKIDTNLFGLRQGVHALGRNINPEKCDFYPCHNAVKTVFEGMVLTATYKKLLIDIGLEAAPTDHMLDELKRLFDPDSPYHNCAFDQLEEIAWQIYEQYMTTEAYEGTLGFDQTRPEDLEANILYDLDSYMADPDYKPNPNYHPSADQLLGNNILFMRDVFWYLELASAVPEGDMGRVFEVLKLLRFSFLGSGATNYGNELLELASNFLYEYPDALKKTLLNNYLVNPSGLPGRWQECDFFQEHNNKAIKTVFNSKNSDWDSKFLRDSVSVNIAGLARLQTAMLEFVGLGKPGSGRSHLDLTADINVLASHYLDANAFSFHSGRSQQCTSSDMFEQGLNKLEYGALTKFLNRSTSSRAGQVYDDDLDVENLDGIEVPLEPLTMEDGMLDAGEPVVVEDPEAD